jgi:outer membrane protein assembly factor BamE (lipoprotein component of BamABCDE complex)
VLDRPISYPRPRWALVAALAACIAVSGCSWLMPPPQVRGNRVDADQLKELVPGTSTRADVTALIGSPTARATFDDNTWLYVSEVTQPRIGATLAVLEQQVTVLTFNDQGVLKDIRDVPKDEGEPLRMVSRTTPSPGTEASFFQQLFGNIGRFNAAGAPTPGGTSGPGGSTSAGGAPSPY